MFGCRQLYFKFEEDSLLDVQDQIVENVETPEVETEDDIAKEDINTEEDKEDYPVYDNSNEVAKNNAIENIMVFTKNGNQ